MKEVFKTIDKYEDLILKAEQDLLRMPETGYFEYKTNAYMIKAFENLGYEVVKADGITGFHSVLDTGKKGPTVLVLAELDSLINFQHAYADPETGAAHTCGHHVQCATIIGVAAALKEDAVIKNLSGKIKLCLVPAEEGIEIGKRNELVRKGVIKFTSGKPEFIYRRYFDDVDIAFMVHAAGCDNSKKFLLGIGSNGVLRKSTVFKGVAAHAGGNPHDGINALNAAATCITTLNSLRETFKEEDFVRVHSIITKGGDAVNAVPEKVVMESYVRAASVKALKETNEKVNRTISACAAAFGAKVEITDMPGSEALHDDENLLIAAKEVLTELVGADAIGYRPWLASSTDMGDVSTLFPAIHAYACGASGTIHSKDFIISDPVNACVDNARFQVGLIVKLLENGGKVANEIIEKFKPQFNSVDEYIEHKLSTSMSKDTVLYNEDGTVTLDYKA
ncbi:MAG: amidohydrolase [Clostridia bacterium]|nr:amidohydrolase [Clostridia bacterium]